MHNLKFIRENPELFKKKITERNVKVDVSELLKLDKNFRKLIQQKEKLEQEKKTISKKKDKSQFDKSKKISIQIKDLEESQKKIYEKIILILNFLPNISLEDVPVGKDENSNKEIKKVGSINKFNFKTQSHYDLGKKLKLMDFDLATKISGARFVFLKGKLAQLERAISNFMIDIHTKEFGYQEISPPLIVSEETMFGTGQLPKFENDQFEIKLDSKQKKYLIPTAEVVLTNMVRDNSLKVDDLPIRVVASTPCFQKRSR